MSTALSRRGSAAIRAISRAALRLSMMPRRNEGADRGPTGFSRTAGELLPAALLAVVYVVAAKLSLFFAVPPGYATAIWPPSGIALAAVLIGGTRMWPGVWLGAAVANFSIQGSALVAGTIACGNALEAVVAAELVRRYAGSGHFDRVGDVVRFAVCVAVAATVAAAVGVSALALRNALVWSHALVNAWTWWQGDFSGMLVVTPLLLAVRARGWPRFSPARATEAALLAAALALTSLLAFGDLLSAGAELPLAFLVFPVVIWAALRFGEVEVTLAAAFVCAIALRCTLQGAGPWGAAPPAYALPALLAYTATLVLIGLVLTAAQRERATAMAKLRELNAQLASGIAQRTRDLERANANLRAEFAKHARHEEALRAERQLKEFLAMLGHELRNPLAAIVHAVALLPRAHGAKRDDLLAVVERQVRHVSRIVDDLLDVSRITRGMIALRKEVVDFNNVVARSVEAMRPQAETRRHALELRLARHALPVDGDPTRLAQIVQNLVSNAVKYTPEGGTITVTLAREEDVAVLRIRDTGIGMSAELLPTVFDLFVQGDRTLDRAEGGLGIGLTLARRLVELHGGSVEAASEGSGTGSEFTVRLPVAQGREIGAGAVERATNALPAVRRRLLVVDDNRDAADTLAALLATMGHDVRTAYDGPAALAAATDLRPHAVFLDIGLPGMSGFDVARRMRSAPALARTTLVAFTGYGQEDDRRGVLAAGFDHHLVKPVALADLAAIVEALPARA